jgi:4'-phosphopantetheinyl transferase
LTQLLDFQPWDPGLGPPDLAAEGLHLWRIRSGTDGADPAALGPLLSPAAQDRAGRLYGQALRDRYVRAHGELRQILGLYLHRSPQDLVFTALTHGKPALLAADVHPAWPQFNLTGSGDLALVAVSAGHPVGVDCEQVRHRTGLDGIARRMFPPDVAEALAAIPEPQRLDAFYTAWTAMEAQVKADGGGLFRPRDPAAPPLTTAHCLPQPGYLAALARHRLPPPGLWGAFEWSGPICRVTGLGQTDP